MHNLAGNQTYSVHWIQDLRWDSFNFSWYLQPKHLCHIVINIQKAARVNGIDDLPGVWQLDAIANTIPENEDHKYYNSNKLTQT